MTGEQNGLAGLLRRDFPTILTFHCVCHRLALATVDTSKEADMKCIENVHNCLRQVWQLLENSPKKMATFIKIQANHNKVSLSGKGEKAVATKLQKACKTRWLSFEASVKSVKECLCTASRNNRQGSKYFTVYSISIFTGKYSKSINRLELQSINAGINRH